jgi:hypothetical protein
MSQHFMRPGVVSMERMYVNWTASSDSFFCESEDKYLSQ